MHSTDANTVAGPAITKSKVQVPELNSKRLILNRLGTHDVSVVFSYASNPKVTELVSWPTHRSSSDTLNFLQSIENCLSATPHQVFLTWALRLRNSAGEAVGVISFSQSNEIAGQLDYVLSPVFWNQGLATEATQTLIAWVFLHHPKIERLQAHCVNSHVASRRVMEKAGMSFEGVRRSGIKMKNQVYDLAIYSILRNEAFSL